MGTVLCVTHRARMAHNAEMNVRLSPRDFVELAPPERPVMGANQPQKMRVWRGQVLMAVVGSAHKLLKNGLRYRVEEVAATARLVRIDDAGAARGEPFQMSLEDVAHDLRLTHTLCYYSCQARTIHGPLLLMQTDSRWVTLRHLIVGLGRAGGLRGGGGVRPRQNRMRMCVAHRKPSGAMRTVFSRRYERLKRDAWSWQLGAAGCGGHASA
jgi:hypothetical protein